LPVVSSTWSRWFHVPSAQTMIRFMLGLFAGPAVGALRNVHDAHDGAYAGFRTVGRTSRRARDGLR